MKLRHRVTGEIRPLLARSLVGRSRSCNLRMGDSAVSGEHALVVWNGTGWEIRDLGSTNGTFVDGARLDPGKPLALHPGARIGFGEEELPWSFDDGSPPGLMAVDLASGQAILASDRMLALPDDAAPELFVYQAAGGAWVAERADDASVRELDDQAILTTTSGRVMRVELPVAHEGTPVAGDAVTLDRIGLRFAVSPDEETVRLWVLHKQSVTALEPREHGYLLLTLARRRLADADKPVTERGWIERDQLLRMLRLDGNGLNVAIFRARQQLSAAGVEGAAGIVEVRRGQRRIGIERLVMSPWDPASP